MRMESTMDVERRVRRMFDAVAQDTTANLPGVAFLPKESPEVVALEATSRHQPSRWAVVAAVVMVAAIATAVGVLVSEREGSDHGRADSTSIYAAPHQDAQGNTFGQLAALPADTSPDQLVVSAPDYIAVLLRHPVRVAGYVKKSDLFVQRSDGSYEWSDAFLGVYSDAGVTEVGALVGRHTLVQIMAGASSAAPASIEPNVAPSSNWSEQALGQCVATTTPRQFLDGTAIPSIARALQGSIGYSESVTGTLGSMSIQQYCTERVALSPPPSSSLIAGYHFSNGHVAADYYKRVDYLEKRDGRTRIVTTQGEPVPYEEAQRIIQSERASASSGNKRR